MARVTTATHPLVSLRVFCGLTRPALSRIAGVASTQLQNIELGRSPMPKEAAILIEAATGCRAESLMRKNSRPLFLTGEPFSRKLWEEWKARIPSEKEITWAEDDLSFRLCMMLRASGHGLYGFVHAVARSLEEAARVAGISAASLDSECRKLADVEQIAITVDELRLLMEKHGKSPEEISARLGGFESFDGCSGVHETYRTVPSVTDDENRKATLAQHLGEPAFLISHNRTAELWRFTLPDGSKIQLESTRPRAVGESSGGGKAVLSRSPFPFASGVPEAQPIERDTSDNPLESLSERRADYEAKKKALGLKKPSRTKRSVRRK